MNNSSSSSCALWESIAKGQCLFTDTSKRTPYFAGYVFNFTPVHVHVKAESFALCCGRTLRVYIGMRTWIRYATTRACRRSPLCVYKYMYICIHTHIHTRVNIHIHTHIYTLCIYAHIQVCIYIYVYTVCMYTFIHRVYTCAIGLEDMHTCSYTLDVVMYTLLHVHRSP